MFPCGPAERKWFLSKLDSNPRPPTGQPEGTGWQHLPRGAGVGNKVMWTMPTPHSRWPFNLSLLAPGGARALHLTRGGSQAPLRQRHALRSPPRRRAASTASQHRLLARAAYQHEASRLQLAALSPARRIRRRRRGEAAASGPDGAAVTELLRVVRRRSRLPAGRGFPGAGPVGNVGETERQQARPRAGGAIQARGWRTSSSSTGPGSENSRWVLVVSVLLVGECAGLIRPKRFHVSGGRGGRWCLRLHDPLIQFL